MERHTPHALLTGLYSTGNPRVANRTVGVYGDCMFRPREQLTVIVDEFASNFDSF